MTIIHKFIFCFLLFIVGMSCSSENKKSVDPSAVLVYDKGMDCMVNSKVDSAIIYFNKAIEIDSSYYYAYYYKEVSECRVKKYDDAIQTLKKMITLWPENSGCYSYLGLIYEIKKDTIQSSLYFNKAVELEKAVLDTMSETNSNYPYFMLTTAIDNVYAGKDKEAHEIFNKAYEACRTRGDITTAGCIKKGMTQSKKQLLENGFQCE